MKFNKSKSEFEQHEELLVHFQTEILKLKTTLKQHLTSVERVDNSAEVDSVYKSMHWL